MKFNFYAHQVVYACVTYTIQYYCKAAVPGPTHAQPWLLFYRGSHFQHLLLKFTSTFPNNVFTVLIIFLFYTWLFYVLLRKLKILASLPMHRQDTPTRHLFTKNVTFWNKYAWAVPFLFNFKFSPDLIIVLFSPHSFPYIYYWYIPRV